MFTHTTHSFVEYGESILIHSRTHSTVSILLASQYHCKWINYKRILKQKIRKQEQKRKSRANEYCCLLQLTDRDGVIFYHTAPQQLIEKPFLSLSAAHKLGQDPPSFSLPQVRQQQAAITIVTSQYWGSITRVVKDRNGGYQPVLKCRQQEAATLSVQSSNGFTSEGTDNSIQAKLAALWFCRIKLFSRDLVHWLQYCFGNLNPFWWGESNFVRP